ncbi:MAG: LPP20 family lipoprotein [Treponema sp.]|nr:LPP20 family lipoprotein [Treponema sp.]
MKKILFVFVSIVFLFASVGCTSESKSVIFGSSKNLAELPDFVKNEPVSDTEIYGIGSAKLKNQDLARRAAETRARRSIANNLSIQVQGMVSDYSREAGTLENDASLQFVEDVGREITNAKLNGVKIVRREQTKDGTWWVLASYSKSNAKDELTNVIENEAPRYAEFKAQEALKMLDAQLDKQQTIIQVDSD